MTRYLITGDAGFIGFHLSRLLVNQGHEVLGLDGMTDYYDPQLKRDRLAVLEALGGFTHTTVMLENLADARPDVEEFAPEVVIHLAAQAGVRYSLENPDAYISSNVEGTLRLLELARDLKPKHLMIASTSSVYGGNTSMPFSELDSTRSPMSLYAATKLATEALSHSFSHLWSIPTTVFRFFTVYGPWGRPDMALFKFVSAIEAGRPIDVYGHGKMARDFTYVDDLVAAIVALSTTIPYAGSTVSPVDTLSPVAPHRVVNLGGGQPVALMDFIEAVERALGTTAEKVLLPMQPGDVVATSSDPTLLRQLIGTVPSTSVGEGVRAFVEWHANYFAQRRGND
ncbi:NAD-dependent epimerase/dehydratase family protein [Microbacterium sp. SORGH_AS_0862]|uniref:NAD-dependent epimerase/dehydratase family protein n=1 Tax=Microbacterium sp. SORGH_AS_0862 TaxID=3041789 RepID=UPI00278D2519|nr:NAD-dependent epimerase/dehydratase family protein [Microbacterium sp. SORGH_AS_0862]MDQ1204471.1 UDP-glucuronate 4-epimerase [Microbacterium sp. SORGH_AS_0862]